MASRPTTMRDAAGVVTVEFAFVVVLFLTLVCGVLELARIMYLFNTLQMVTQRAATAAANADFSSPAAIDTARQRAVFRETPGALSAGAPVTDRHVRIEYLSLSDSGEMAAIPTANLPSCPANNRINCLQNPYGSSCIRLVRASICDPAVTGQCNSVAYEALFSFVAIPLQLPKATAIATAETLGAPPGKPPCP